VYGLVNRAMQELIETSFGQPTWERIRARAGVGVDVFLSMKTYPDELTVQLLGAASDELAAPPEALLRRFGEYWVEYAAHHGYRDLLQARGDSLFSFIARLDDLHSRLSLVFTELRPPSFQTHVIDQASMRLCYMSERSGLAPFVVGLLHGLAKLFEERITVEHVVIRGEGQPHDEFVVRLEARSAS